MLSFKGKLMFVLIQASACGPILIWVEMSAGSSRVCWEHCSTTGRDWGARNWSTSSTVAVLVLCSCWCLIGVIVTCPVKLGCYELLCLVSGNQVSWLMVLEADNPKGSLHPSGLLKTVLLIPRTLTGYLQCGCNWVKLNTELAILKLCQELVRFKCLLLFHSTPSVP